MTTQTYPTIADLLKYADLQMAAEAFIRDRDTNVLHSTGQELIDALKKGNDHASRFTETQAQNFADHWKVLDQCANTPTGFSGTLFKCILSDPATGAQKDQLVISFRSTEFIDDAAHDNQATNAMEIAKTGFAWGQIRDMQEWCMSLESTHATDFAAAGNQFAVTGYSLGGHLASVFNELYAGPNQLQQVVTFNGAGVGGVRPTTTLQTLVNRFTTLAKNENGTAIQFEDANVAAIYARARNAINSASHTGTISMADNLALRDIVEAPTSTLQTQRDAQMVLDAIGRINTLRSEVTRLGGIHSGVDSLNQPSTDPIAVADSAIGQENLDYQMAVLTVAKDTDATSLRQDIARTFGGKAMLGHYANQFDVVGATSPSAVSNSQWHIGADMQVFIEDQPLYRGGVVLDVVLQTLKHFDVKLLVNDYATKDFGDTHSLVLLHDSLNVQNALLQLLPADQRAGAGATMQSSQGVVGILQTILQTASNRVAVNGDLLIGGSQGKTEGDVLENTLNALADLVLGPAAAANNRLKGSPDGATWALPKWPENTPNPNGYTTRKEFYELLQTITKAVEVKRLDGQFTLSAASGATLAADARTDFAAFAALYSLSPFVFKLTDANQQSTLFSSTWSAVYSAWDADFGTGSGTSTVKHFSDDWLRDRAALLERKSYFNTVNASYDSTQPDAYGHQVRDLNGVATPINDKYNKDDIVWKWKESDTDQTIQRGSTTGSTRYVVFGGEGDDTGLTGGANNDRLYGGTGNDTYQFSGTWGKDIICDTDGKGSLTINGHSIGLAQAIGTPGSSTWRYEISPGVSVFLKVVDAAGGGAGKNLVITQGPTSATQGDPANSITIQNFDIDAAKGPTGYLGVMLEPTVKVATTGNNLPAGQSNFFNPVGADVSSLAGQASNVIEGTGKTISVYLNQAAKAGETAVLNLQNLASAGMKAIFGDRVVDANGATITLAEGQTEIRFALIQDGALSADVSGSVSVTYNGTGGSVTSNAWGVNLKDAGVASKTYNGDQRAPLNGSGNYDWASTSWASNGTLNGGVAEPGFSDVIRGAADNDTISGLGGNDALDGGAGNDRLDGGTGDDLIGGGAGSDNIRGGDGNDFINSSATLTMGGRVSPTDSWSPPNGQQVITQGARWGIYKDTMPDGTPVTVWGGSNSPAGNEADVVDAGAGNDQVISSGGDDRVQGGLGDDQLDGMGGNDVLEGGDGKDSINGDGRIQTGFLDSVAAPYHGADFVDGGAGDDVLVGGSGADSMDGGTGNNTYVVDNVGDVIVDALGVATNSVAACARQTGVNGRFGSKPHGRHLNTQLLRARAARSTRQSPHARSMRPAGQKWPGRRMNSAQSTLMAGVL